MYRTCELPRGNDSLCWSAASGDENASFQKAKRLCMEGKAKTKPNTYQTRLPSQSHTVEKPNQSCYLINFDPIVNRSSLLNNSLRSKRFLGVWEQRKTEKRNFRYFVYAENGVRANKNIHLSPCNSLPPNCTETLTQANLTKPKQTKTNFSSVLLTMFVR